MMIKPTKIRLEARKKEEENLRFRTFLKCEADEDVLDQQFLELHNELFENYDCSQCRNCCKEYRGSIPVEDIEQDALYLKTTPERFVKRYLGKKDNNGHYETKHKPCDFLLKDGSCKLGDCKPTGCKDFPYTNKPDRLFSLYSVLSVINVCPVAFEIFERLKEIYGFKK